MPLALTRRLLLEGLTFTASVEEGRRERKNGEEYCEESKLTLGFGQVENIGFDQTFSEQFSGVRVCVG